MLILPAIDLYEGCAVRLVQGDYQKRTVYSEDPAALAAQFRRSGAQWLHVVDLEGAKSGDTPNAETVGKLAAAFGGQVEVGGGIRSADTVRRYFDLGVQRVILGTAALRDPAFLQAMLDAYGARVAVGVDLREGRVAVQGWTETTGESGMDFCARLQAMGVETVICTDISRDGLLRGANAALYRDMAARFTMKLIASGGVASLEDVRALAGLGLYGAILGKALYTGDVALESALACAKEEPQ